MSDLHEMAETVRRTTVRDFPQASGAPACAECGHEMSDHVAGVPHGRCLAMIEGCGPADNMDVYETPCDCTAYRPERPVQPEAVQRRRRYQQRCANESVIREHVAQKLVEGLQVPGGWSGLTEGQKALYRDLAAVCVRYSDDGWKNAAFRRAYEDIRPELEALRAGWAQRAALGQEAPTASDALHLVTVVFSSIWGVLTGLRDLRDDEIAALEERSGGTEG